MHELRQKNITGFRVHLQLQTWLTMYAKVSMLLVDLNYLKNYQRKSLSFKRLLELKKMLQLCRIIFETLESINK